jgi:MFS family permease
LRRIYDASGTYLDALKLQKGKERDKAYGIYGIGIILGLATIAGQLLGGYFISSHPIPEN